jgi:hypothetical protein
MSSLTQRIPVKNFVPAVAPVGETAKVDRFEAKLIRVGGELYNEGASMDGAWPRPVRVGYIKAAQRALRGMGYGDGSAYMVGQGQEVSL